MPAHDALLPPSPIMVVVCPATKTLQCPVSSPMRGRHAADDDGGFAFHDRPADVRHDTGHHGAGVRVGDACRRWHGFFPSRFFAIAGLRPTPRRLQRVESAVTVEILRMVSRVNQQFDRGRRRCVSLGNHPARTGLSDGHFSQKDIQKSTNGYMSPERTTLRMIDSAVAECFLCRLYSLFETNPTVG